MIFDNQNGQEKCDAVLTTSVPKPVEDHFMLRPIIFAQL